MAASKIPSKKKAAPKKAGVAPADSHDRRKGLPELQAALEAAAAGDFSKEVPLPSSNSELANIFAGVRAMQDVIREQQEEISLLNKQLQAKTGTYNRTLEEAQALTHLGSWQWDIATDTITWSDELYRIYGMKPQERAIGFEEFIGLIHPEDRRLVEDIIAESFQNGKPFEFEHRIILPSGSERILKGMGKTMNDDTGKPLRMLGTSQDITLSKQLDRAKDEFISLVSHQLRTPLTIIRIHGNILEDGIVGSLDPKQEKHIRTMTRASVRLIELVDDILSISRVTLNRIKVNAKPTDPNKVIAACVEEALPAAQNKGAVLLFEPSETVGTVAIDTVIFGEVLRNLISNAIRYTGEARGKIKLSFTKEKKSYVLRVEDNGIGIPVADQPCVFDRFYRANNATVVDSEGSGLGLYIVKLFIEAAGGDIRFDSVEGKGTTFYVSFPLHGMRAQQSSGASS